MNLRTYKRPLLLMVAGLFACNVALSMELPPDKPKPDNTDTKPNLVLPEQITPELKFGTGPVVWIPIDDGSENMPGGGMIDRWTKSFVKRQIAYAREQNAAAIVLHIRSNGGDAFAMIEIAREIQNAAPIPTIAYVYDHAWSAAAVLALACDVVYMTPVAAIGDAQVIQSGGEGGINVAPEKIASPFRAYFRMIIEKKAERSGFPDSLLSIVEAMMDPGIELVEIELDGVRRILKRSLLMGNEEKGYTYNEEKVRILNVLLKEGKLLSATSKEALNKFRFIDGIAENREALLKEFSLQEYKVVQIEKTWEDNLQRFVSGHFVTGILMMLGMLGVFLVLRMGAITTGLTVAAFAFGAFFYSNSIAGTASGFEIILFLIGAVLLLLEVFVIPGFGVAGISGIASIVISLGLSMVEPTAIPGFEGASIAFDWDGFAVSVMVVFTSMIGATIGSFLLMKVLPSVPMFNRVILQDVAEAEVGTKDELSGVTLESLVGSSGVSKTALRPAGIVIIKDMQYDAVADAEFIDRDTEISVTGVRMGNLLVQKSVIKEGA